MSNQAPKLSPEKLLLLQRRLKGAGANAAATARTIQPRTQPGSAPLSFVQHQMWLIEQMAPGTTAYHLPIAFKLKGTINVPALEAAFCEVIKRHEILRTTFSTKDGDAVQEIQPAWELKIERSDLEQVPAGQARENALHEHLLAEAKKPFDLTQLPLLRVSLFALGEREYALLVNLHHILADGLSLSLLINELDATYHAFSSGVKPTLPPLPVQYADYAIWERSEATTNNRAAQLSFWKERLKGTLPVLELPWDKPRPTVQSFKGGNVFLEIPGQLCTKLQTLATAQDSTFFMVALAAFSAILHRYSSASEIIVGTPVANRSADDVQPLIGNFLNILALRCETNPDQTFNQHLRRTREIALDAFSHREVPFQQVVGQLHLPRDTSRNPIFQAMLQVLPKTELKLGNLAMEDLHFDPGFAQFDLSLHLHESAGGYRGRFEYCSDLLERTTVENLAAHFLNLLRQVAADPDQTLQKIPILSSDERRQILADWNNTAVPYPRDICLHQLIEAQIDRTPNAPAVVFENRQLTYSELNTRSNQLAHFLQGRGLGPGSLVGICVERSLELVVGLLGILKAGAAYVPIDPSYPQNRVAYMLEDSQVQVLLTQQHLTEKLPPHRATTISLDSEWSKIAEQSGTKPITIATAADPAYMIYTSGSTGRPKGALNSHRGIVNRLLWMQDEYRLTPADSVLQKTPFSFDVSVWEFFWPLLTGARLVVAIPGGHQDPAYLIDTICRENITVMHFVPSMLRVFLDEPGVERCRSLREVICSGEALPYDLQEAFFARLPANLENLYGPTEAAVDVTYWACQRNSKSKIVPIGRPVANTQIYILDFHLNPVPVGLPGELHLGGVQVGLGYFNRPDLTAEKFIPDPFGTEPTARLYKTGDLARWLPDGSIEYLGRIDHQVKIRGLRIELGEIESVLVQHPAVKEAVVVAREETGDKRLVAYLVPGPAKPEISALRDHLLKQLPDYMVPAAFVFLPNLPLSSNGKIDRKALPAPASAQPESALYVPPRNATERQVAAIWQEVLHAPKVSAHDNFFELGGHSLLALKVVSRVRQQIGLELPLSAVFAAPTVEKMALKILSLHSAQADEAANALSDKSAPSPGDDTAKLQAEPPIKRPVSEPALLSFSQERLWFLDQLEESSALNNIAFAIRLRGAFRADCLEQALAEIVRRHESLRTIFPPSEKDRPPVQRILETFDFKLTVVDLPTCSPSTIEQAAWMKIEEIARRPMQLAHGPLFHAHLLKLAPEDHFLALTVHHIVADGWSFEVLFRELSILYADFLSGRPAVLPPLNQQYADFAHWQHSLLKTGRLEHALRYWVDRLRGIPPLLELPTDFPRPAQQSYRGAYCERTLSASLTAKIRRLGDANNATMFMTVLAGLQAFLHRYSGQPDILVGSPVTNRSRVEFEPLIGFFVNMIPLRADFSSPLSVSKLIAQVRQSTLDALSLDELPFEMLVRALKPERNMSHAPLFQVALMFLQEGHHPLQLAGLDAKTDPVSTATSKYDLTLLAREKGDELLLWLEYSTDLFTAQTAERMLAHFECLMDSMAGNPELEICRLILLPPDEEKKILVDWNRTALAYPADQTVHGLFEAQAARTPNAIALEHEGERLSYAELNLRSNLLAAELRQKGVGVETPVGIFVERSADMVIAVLATLKAGGYYIPLDPAFPKDRLTYMVSDAKIPVLLTQSRLVVDLPEHQAQIVQVDKLARSAAAPRSHSGQNQSTSANLAYVLFTSGSTGRPKGVQIPHRAVVNFLHSMRHEPGLQPTDVLLAITTLSFDIAGLELFLPLTTGAKVVIASREDAIDGSRLAKLIKTAKITVMQATPATWRMLIDAGWEGNPRLKILCGGEAIDRGLADQLLKRCGELWNMYGPTETTIWSTVEKLKPEEPITIGRPVANTQVYILDSNGRPTPPGVIGELLIGGDGVARGYLNRPELTGEKFVPNPFVQQPDARLYRTGDLARYRRDGRIEFLGRSDFQVKIRGFRIEIGEIETALAAIDGVARAIVTVREDTPGDKRLVAYLVPKQPFATQNGSKDGPHPVNLEMAALRTSLRANLPEYMIPSTFVFLEALPLTPNGKVDRKALPQPDKIAIPEAAYEPPQNPTEEKLAAIMGSLLKVPRVGRTDDFFALGGYSILAVSLFNEIEREFSRRIPLATLFRAPTVAALAAELTTASSHAKGWGSLVPIQPLGERPRFFCVHGAGGNILLYRDLVRTLGTDYPFYGLQSQGLDRKTKPLATVKEMAEHYLKEIRALQPHGPYCLGGYCLGGTIAYEMAQRLRQEGEDVALLALFDTYNFTQMNKAKALPYLWQKVAFHGRNIASLSWKDLSGYLVDKARIATDGELRALWKSLSKSLFSKRTRQPGEATVQEINDAAADAYRPEIYAGSATVFKPRKNYNFFPDPKMGWGDCVTGGLEVVALPVNPHAMLMTPFVQHLAHELRQRLDSIHARKTTQASMQ